MWVGGVTRSQKGHCGPCCCAFAIPQLFCLTSAAVPHYLRSCSALPPHCFRTASALLPHCFRTASALLPHSVVAKPHFPWTKIVISSDEKRRSSRSLPGPFAAEQPTDVSYLSRVVRCAPASDEAPRGPNWQSINRRTRRPKFHDERPATPRCLLALPTEASSFP